VGRLYVERARLLHRLNHGLSTAATLVCAPAGFGKTTLVSAWVAGLGAGEGEGGREKSAWLTLDERDSSLGLFLHYFVTAVQRIFAQACSQMEDLLRAPALPRLPLLAAALSNDLAALPSEIVMVLDDNTVSEHGAAYDLLAELLRQPPHQLHLVIIRRREPPLPLARLRARGQLTEIRTRDLRFTRDEIRAYLDLCLPGVPDAAAPERLELATEGWVTGLHLILRTVGATDPSVLERIIGEGGATHVSDYLLEEVLSVQPEPIRAFLLRTAILDQYNPSLAEAVLAQDVPGCEVRRCIEQIERADLFVTRDDEHGEWYSCHPLFRELLLRQLFARLSPEQVNTLHERAATWFGQSGSIDDAVHHALAADNLDLAARLIEQGLGNVLNRDDRSTLERWLKLLPDAFLQQSPGLLMIKAWVMQFSWRLEAQARILDQIESLLASGAQSRADGMELDEAALRGQSAVLRGQLAFLSNQHTRCVELCRESLELLPPSWTFPRGAALLYQSLSEWCLGEGPDVADRLAAHFERLETKNDLVGLRLLLALCFIRYWAGDLERLDQVARVLVDQAERGESATLRHWGYYFVGIVHYERNEIGQARALLSRLVEYEHTIFMALLHDGFALTALTLRAAGDLAGALELSQRLRETDLERLGDESDASRSLRARLQLLEGDVEGAGRWADTLTSRLPDRPLLWIANPHLTRARILIERNWPPDAAAALDLVDAVARLGEQTHNVPVQIESLALRALALDAMERRDEGLEALSRAAGLCRPGDFVRVFAELGPPMRAMLGQLRRQGRATDTVRSLYAAVGRDGPNSGGPNSGGPYAGGPYAGGAGRDASPEGDRTAPTSLLVEPLTARELEILAQLRENRTGKEIARMLVLSTATVQRHTANIYGKLGVHRRSEAVSLGERLGILAPR
jgi:LuxR family maltose regulon positive regulatory protein